MEKNNRGTVKTEEDEEEDSYSMTSAANAPYSELINPTRNVMPTANYSFKAEWQNFPEFQLWLRPIPDDKTKAWCQACEKIFKADLKSLRVHGVGRSHGRMVQSKFPEAATTSPPPAAVYNVITDRKGTYGLGILSKSDNSSTAGSTLYVNPTNPTTNVLTCDPKQDKDNYVIVSMPKGDIEEQENIDELQQLQFEQQQAIEKKSSSQSQVDLTKMKMRGISNDKRIATTATTTTTTVAVPKIINSNSRDSFAEDLIETEDLDEVEDDFDEDEDEEEEDDDSIYEGKSSLHRKRGALKRNAAGYAAGSFHNYEIALVTQPAPFWKAKAIVNGHVSELKLSDYLGRYLLLFFYPQDFSKLCSQEINDLSNRISDFRNMNTEIVACSVDSYLTHQVWSKMSRQDGGVAYPKIPLLSDYTHDIARSYGCYLPSAGHSLRAHYIIDTKGILRHTTVNDIHVTRDVGEILKLVEAFQKVDESEKQVMESEETT